MRRRVRHSAQNCDQIGGRIFADQLNVNSAGAAKAIGVHVNGIDRADVLLRCLQGGGCSVWAKATGGRDLSAGKGAPGQVSIITGATGTSDRQYAVENGGRMVVRGVYHEVSGSEPRAVSLAGSGSLCIDATRFSYRTSPTVPMFALDAFKGQLTVLTGMLLPVDTAPTSRFEIAGDGSACNMLAMGNMLWVNEPDVTSGKVLLNKANPPARAGLLLCNMNSGKHLPKGFATLDEVGQSDDAFVLRMVAPLRQSRVWLPDVEAPAGCTDVRIHRVIVNGGGGGCGVELVGGEAR